MVIAVISSSVSILDDDEEELVECTELSVELRSERRESRIVFARRNSISGVLLAVVGVAVVLLLLLLLDLTDVRLGDASTVASFRLLALCSVNTELVFCVMHRR